MDTAERRRSPKFGREGRKRKTTSIKIQEKEIEGSLKPNTWGGEFTKKIWDVHEHKKEKKKGEKGSVSAQMH